MMPPAPLLHEVKKARARQLARKRGLTTGEFRALPLPHKRWWRVINEIAERRDPHCDCIIDLEIESINTPEIDGFPPSLEDWHAALPIISQDEAMVLVEKFLRIHRGSLRAGVTMMPLHYVALAAYYCPHRHPLRSLEELVRGGDLTQTDHGFSYLDSPLTWPLVTSTRTIDRINSLVIATHVPTIARADAQIARLKRALSAARSFLRRLLARS